MADIAGVLRDEISRLARKEVRRENNTLKKASAQYRRDIAELKRQASDLQSRVALLEKQVLSDLPTQTSESDAKRMRFTAKGLRSNRKRLGLSAADYGKLVGVGGQTIYNWENEASAPRKKHLPALASLRQIGKREANARLEQLKKHGRK